MRRLLIGFVFLGNGYSDLPRFVVTDAFVKFRYRFFFECQITPVTLPSGRCHKVKKEFFVFNARVAFVWMISTY
jgi:hypothetical protein